MGVRAGNISVGGVLWFNVKRCGKLIIIKIQRMLYPLNFFLGVTIVVIGSAHRMRVLAHFGL